MKVIAVIKKRYDFIELEEIVNKFKPSHLCLYTYTNEKIDHFSKNLMEDLRVKFSGKVEKLESNFFSLNDVKNGRDIYNIVSKSVEGKSVVVLPLANGKYFVQAVSFFNKNPDTTVFHISDGILDYIPRYKYYFTRSKLNITGVVRSVVSYIRLINNISDYSYSVFSNYSAFSKKTTKISPNFNYQKPTRKRLGAAIPKINLNRNLILLIPTKAVNEELLISHYKLEGLIDQIIVSTKTGEIILNKKKYWLNGAVTAEELLQTGYFYKVYSGPSTAAFYAKELDSRISVAMLSTFEERSIIGYTMDRWLRKEAIKSSINYEYLSRK